MTTAEPRRELAWIPRGVRLDDQEFESRHRALLRFLIANVPVLALIGVVHHSLDAVATTELVAAALCAVVGAFPLSRTTRAVAVSLGLMAAPAALVEIFMGQTTMHIYFYVILAVVSLYQMWTPFLLAIVFVAVHHFTMSEMSSMSVFSEPVAQRNPLVFALVHAGFLLMEAVALAACWRYQERAESARQVALSDARRQAEAQLEAQNALVDERAQVARDADERLAEQQRSAALVAGRLAALDTSGARLATNVATASSVINELVTVLAEIDAASEQANSAASEAGTVTEHSLAAMARLGATIDEVSNIAKTIATIATQTNLLALNATIEAARAGEAGRGFAVVAGEVKDLATETAAATDRIRGIVSNVQTDSHETTEMIARMKDVIARVVETQSTIAAAVATQTNATAEARTAIFDAADDASAMVEDLRAVAAAGTP